MKVKLVTGYILLCIFIAGCGLATSPEPMLKGTKTAEDIISEIELAGEESGTKSGSIQVTPLLPKYVEAKEKGLHITIEDNKLSCNLINADLRETLLKIAELTQLQFVFAENIYGRVNAKFNNLELEDGIYLILDTAHYVFEKETGVYTIHRAPDAPDRIKYHEVRLRYVPVEKLMERIAALYGLPFQSGSGMSTGGSIDESKDMPEMKPFAGPTSLMMKGVTIVKAIDQNVLFISGESHRVDEMLELIAVLDQKVPQVLIETYLVEYDDNALKESGIDLSADIIRSSLNMAFNGNLTSILDLPAIIEGKNVWEGNGTSSSENGSQIPTNGGINSNGGDNSGLLNLFSVGNSTEDKKKLVTLAAIIHALMDEDKLKVMSKPYIIVDSGAQAIISAASEQYVIAAVPEQAGTLEKVETKTMFRIIPTVISDNAIHVQLSLEQSEFTTPQPNAVLATNKNTARTNLVVVDGETIVIGGINSTREVTTSRSVPILRNIPILKNLFGASRKFTSSRKVNFYVTPHILPLKEGIIKENIEP